MCDLDLTAINALILLWRKKAKNAASDNERLIARCYVDAYQNVRVLHNQGALAQHEPGDDGRYA